MDEIKNEVVYTAEEPAEEIVNTVEPAIVGCRCACNMDTNDGENENENENGEQSETENTEENKEFVIDGENITDSEALHEYIAELMQFPDYYGANLDALYDCLTEIGEPVSLSIINSDKLSEQIGEDYFEAFKQVLEDAVSENNYLTVSIE